MATVNTRFCDPNSTAGGDGTTNSLTGAFRAYVSLNAWEAARQADLPAGDIIEKVICSSDDAGSTHVADTTAVTVVGWTTDATRYIQIEAASSHGGKWNDNVYRLDGSSGIALRISENYVKVIGIQVSNSATSAVIQDGVCSGDGGIYVSRCIIKGTYATGNRGIYIFDGSNTLHWYIYNNIIYHTYTGTVSASGILANPYSQSIYVFNNTINNFNVGIERIAGSVKAVNNILYACTTAASGTFIAGTGYNATDKAFMAYTVTGGATSDRLSQTFTFVDEANDDFHLASTDAGARNYGLSDPGSGLFSDDIDGVTRTGTWDIGADEYVAAGGGFLNRNYWWGNY